MHYIIEKSSIHIVRRLELWCVPRWHLEKVDKMMHDYACDHSGQCGKNIFATAEFFQPKFQLPRKFLMLERVLSRNNGQKFPLLRITVNDNFHSRFTRLFCQSSIANHDSRLKLSMNHESHHDSREYISRITIAKILLSHVTKLRKIKFHDRKFPRFNGSRFRCFVPSKFVTEMSYLSLIHI